MNQPRPTFFNLPYDKQKRITEAAIEEFAEKGFHGASINKIVKQLKIAKGSIFQYFGDKKGLFYFVFDRCMDQVKDYLKQVRDATKGEPLSIRLTGVLLAGVEFVNTHPLLYRLYVRELASGRTRFSGDLSAVIRRHSQEFLVSLIDESRLNGELPADIDMDTAGFIIDAVMDRFLRAHMTPDMAPGLGVFKADEKTITARAEAVVFTILNGIARAAGNQPVDEYIEGPYILICAAVHEELAHLAQCLETHSDFKKKNGFSHACCRISNIPVVLVQTGPGAVNAARAITAVVERARPSLILQTGCGGAFARSGLDIGDIAVASEEIDAAIGIEDETNGFPPRPLPFPLLAGPGFTVFNRFPINSGLVDSAMHVLEEIFSRPNEPGNKSPAIFKGPFVSVSTITATDRTAERLFNAYSPCLEQMEGAATAQVAMSYGIPFLEIRSVSNFVGRRNREDWDIALAAKHCGKAVSGLVSRIGKDLINATPRDRKQ